jgi:dolichol-phosphate mannosyltransferase
MHSQLVLEQAQIPLQYRNILLTFSGFLFSYNIVINKEDDDVTSGFVKSSNLLVVVPTYNEKENIEPFLKEVFEYIPENADILVIDDNSPDGTALVVKEIVENYKGRIHLIVRKKKMGGASAFLQGFSWGIEHGYDLLLAMDADFSHNPKYIPVMLEQIQNSDVVIGSRNVKGGGIENRTLIRNLITKGAALYCRILLGCPIRDFTGGYNLWSKTALEKIGVDTIKTRGYSFQIEMKYKAFKSKCRIVEIPIIFPDRKYGTSKMSKTIFFQALVDVWRINMLIGEIIKFGITGAIGTVTNLFIFFLCVDKFCFPEIPVSIICFLIAGTQNYIINHNWSFRQNTMDHKPSFKKWALFIAASLCGLVVNIVVLEAVLSHYLLPFKFIAQAAGIACGMIINFVFSKSIVFRGNK